MVVNVGLLGMVPLLGLAAVVVAVGQRGVIVNVRVPGGPMLEVVTETPSVVVTNVPMIVTMLSRWMGVLGLLPFSFGPLPDVCHRGASFRDVGYPNDPARHVPGDRGANWMAHPLQRSMTVTIERGAGT